MSPNKGKPAMNAAPAIPSTLVAPPTGIDLRTKDERADAPRTDLPAIVPNLSAPNTGSGDKSNTDGTPSVTPDTTAPITVPAAPSAANLWAASLAPQLQAVIDEYFKTAPIVGTAWVEPTEDEVNERIATLMADRNVKPMNFKAIGEIAEEVELAIKAERKAAGGDNAEKLKKEYAAAILDAINKNLLPHVRSLGGMKTRATSEKTSDGVKKTPKTPRDATTSEIKPDAATRKAMRAAPYIQWARDNGMEHFIRIDTPNEHNKGIKGEWHARALLPSGNYQEVIFNDADGTYTLTDRVTDGVFRVFGNDDPKAVFDTGSANGRMSVLIANESTRAVMPNGWTTILFPTVKATIEESAKNAS